MTLNERIAKLHKQQEQITAAIRQAEAKASVRQRRADTRAKLILGGTLLSMPAGERNAVLSMFLDRMPERDRRFVGLHLAEDQSPSLLPASDARQPS